MNKTSEQLEGYVLFSLKRMIIEISKFCMACGIPGWLTQYFAKKWFASTFCCSQKLLVVWKVWKVWKVECPEVVRELYFKPFFFVLECCWNMASSRNTGICFCSEKCINTAFTFCLWKTSSHTDTQVDKVNNQTRFLLENNMEQMVLR